MSIRKMKIMINKFKTILCAFFLLCGFVACVDNDDEVPENYYQSSKITAADFLSENDDRLSQFVEMLKRTPYYSLLATYGKFTVFAPDNDAFDTYLKSSGYKSVSDIPEAVCDTLARTHIVKKGAFFTTDIGEGALPELNMEDAYIVLSLDSDVMNNNAIMYYANKTSRMVEYDDSVTNGVVHIVNKMIEPTADLLADRVAADSLLSIFAKALKITGIADSLTKDIDETYSWGSDKKSLDSLYNGVMVRCTSGSALMTKSFWPEKRYFKYTMFVEPDSVFHRHGINNVDDLAAYVKQIYDATYPEDAGKYDNDPRDRRNPLNRFISYHILDRVMQYNQFIGSKQLRQGCWLTSVADAEEFFETLCPHTLLRMAEVPSGLYINRKGLGDKKVSIRGVKVLSPSESGTTNQNAKNGVYHYLDDILTYNVDTREQVLNCRVRVDATTLSPDFQNCNGRGRFGEDILTGFRNNYIKNWTVRGTKAYVGVHSDVGYWNSYMANAVCVSGIFDVTFKLPPVPSGTYEIRLGYTCGEERGVVQFYLNNEPCGIPVDLRVYGPDPTIGWKEDTDDADENTANDKAMHNRGFMKGMDSYRSENAEKPLRGNNWNLRRILTTQYLDGNQDYYLRCRQVLEDDQCYWSFDYIEICPKSVYGSPEGENTH
jgi:uncharacterized surface protein with fasciclin (FAS1) repeats